MQPEQRKYTSNGERKVSSVWSVRFRCHRGLRHRLQLFKSKSASTQFCARLERLVDAKAGGEPINSDLMNWIESMPKVQLNFLIEWKLIDPRRISSAVPIEEHVESWRESILVDGRTEMHIKATVTRCLKVLRDTGVSRWTDIDSGVIGSWLKSLTGPKGWSVRTRNTHLQSVKQFTRWMVTEEHALIDPLLKLKLLSAGSGEARRPRRALAIEECRLLIQAAETSNALVAGVDGKTRGLLYRIALLTGLRLGELCRLEVGWVEFGNANRPTIIKPPAWATKAGRKSGRVDTIVVPPELHTRLHAACRGRHPKALLLHRPGPRESSSTAIPSTKGAQMIKHDLATAGIRYVDKAGKFVDFHSLRHTALTLFAGTGASMDDMLKLSRHSDPKVTQGYLHSELRSRAEILNRLPSLDSDDENQSLPKAVGADFSGVSTGPTGGVMPMNAKEDKGAPIAKMGGNCGSPIDLQSIALPLGHAASWGGSVAADPMSVDPSPSRIAPKPASGGDQ